VLTQEWHGVPLKMDRDNFLLHPKTLIWFFEVEYINDLPWIQESRIGRSSPHLGTHLFFGGILPKEDTFQMLGENYPCQFWWPIIPPLGYTAFFLGVLPKEDTFQMVGENWPYQFWWLACSSLSWILFLLKKSSQDFGIALDPPRSLLSFCYLSTTVFESYIHGLLKCVFKLLNLSRGQHYWGPPTFSYGQFYN
jgi:hypothetical protein